MVTRIRFSAMQLSIFRYLEVEKILTLMNRHSREKTHDRSLKCETEQNEIHVRMIIRFLCFFACYSLSILYHVFGKRHDEHVNL